jgi:hypothetical protein
VDFAHDLQPQGDYNFTVNSVLRGVMLFLPGGIEYNFTAAPILNQDAIVANSTFIAVAGSTLFTFPNSTYRSVTIGGFPGITNEYRPWKAYSSDNFTAPFRSVNQYFLNLNSAERDISIGNTGTLAIADTYYFHNPAIAISDLTIALPSGASNVMAYDQVGAIWATPQNPSPPYQITVSPRYNEGFRGSENFTLTLTYNLPQSMYVKKLSGLGNYNLTLTFLDNHEDVLVQHATVNIIAPNGLTVSGVHLPPQSVVSSPIEVSENQKTFILQGITNLNNVTFSMTFSYVPFWSASEILPWILGFEVVIFAFVIAFRRRRVELEVPVPVEKLREFVGLYDERLALSRELVVMDEDVNRGSLVKHEFRRRKKVMDMRLDEINRSLMQLKTDLRAMSGHYDELIRRIDKAEAEVEASRASLSQFKEITKRLDRAEETVETVLITLREEAR